MSMINKGPSIMVANSDQDAINIVNGLSGNNYITIEDALGWISTQDDIYVQNKTIENIVTDGLVLYLDSSSVGSYPKGGTTWYDMSEGSNDWTIPNGIYTNGTMNFTADSASKSPPISWQGVLDCTIETWFYPKTGGIKTTCCDTIFGRYDFRFFMINQSIYTMIGFDNGSGVRTYSHPDYSISYDNWHHMVGLRRDNRFIMWIDGVERSNTAFGAGLSLWDTSATWFISTNLHPNLNITICRIYNRGLSDTEIIQNFNSQKSRFGL